MGHILSSIRFSGPTIEEKMEATHFRPSGFDYLRLLLCAGVIFQHSGTTSYGHNNGNFLPGNLDRCWVYFIVPMFFSLSGFLVSGSFFRCQSLISFLGLRMLRIIPALACEVILSALLIGPFLTALPIQQYFSDQSFIYYFYNIIGDIHYELPGLFLSNPIPMRVNNQLWTIPFELICYMTITVLAIIRIALRRYWLLYLCIAIQAALLVFAVEHQGVYKKLNILGGITGYHDCFFFIIGVLFYSFRDKIILSKHVCGICFIVVELLLMAPGGTNIVGFPIVYITIFLGMQNPPKANILFSGDYSYGMYLYGFPLQQVIAYLMPDFRAWYVSFPLGLLGAFLIANYSWWLVEKPALALKNALLVFESILLNRLPYWFTSVIDIRSVKTPIARS